MLYYIESVLPYFQRSIQAFVPNLASREFFRNPGFGIENQNILKHQAIQFAHLFLF